VEDERRLGSLMAEAQSGNKEACQQLFPELAIRTRRLAKHLLSRSVPEQDGSVLEDLTQEVLLAIHSNRSTYDQTRPFFHWFYAIARFKVVDHIRAVRNLQHYVEDSSRKGIDRAGLNVAVITGEAEDLIAAFSKLTPKQRDIIELTKIQGLSVKEVASIMSLSESNVKVLTHRALKTLKWHFRDQS
jgi:RNA polymerase sigma-70 factor (ECF subfamily)